jgi:AcrR family transcriptional regulator
MSTPSLNSGSVTKRQSAHSLRTRTRLIEDAQEVLAEFGLEATVEQLASHIGVSPTTIYKYFGSKEALFSEAILQLWHEWLEWACEEKTPCESLDIWVTTNRKFIRARQTHPFYGKVLRNILSNPEFLLNSVKGPGEQVIRLLAERGEISREELDVKVLLWAQAAAGIFSGVHATEVLSTIQADQALARSLKILDVTEDKIKKMLSIELNLAV